MQNQNQKQNNYTDVDIVVYKVVYEVHTYIKSKGCDTQKPSVLFPLHQFNYKSYSLLAFLVPLQYE